MVQPCQVYTAALHSWPNKYVLPSASSAPNISAYPRTSCKICEGRAKTVEHTQVMHNSEDAHAKQGVHTLIASDFPGSSSNLYSDSG